MNKLEPDPDRKGDKSSNNSTNFAKKQKGINAPSVCLSLPHPAPQHHAIHINPWRISTTRGSLHSEHAPLGGTLTAAVPLLQDAAEEV